MNRRRWVPVVLVAGAVALAHNAVYLARELGGGARPVGVEEDELQEEAGEEQETGAAALAPLRQSEVLGYLARLPEGPRSPFLTRAEADALRGDAPVATGGMPRVEGVLWSRGRRVAWIDGAPRSEGERVRSYELERIAPHAVVLRRSGERLELRVEPDPTAPPSVEVSADAD